MEMCFASRGSSVRTRVAPLASTVENIGFSAVFLFSAPDPCRGNAAVCSFEALPFWGYRPKCGHIGTKVIDLDS